MRAVAGGALLGAWSGFLIALSLRWHAPDTFSERQFRLWWPFLQPPHWLPQVAFALAVGALTLAALFAWEEAARSRGGFARRLVAHVSWIHLYLVPVSLLAVLDFGTYDNSWLIWPGQVICWMGGGLLLALSVIGLFRKRGLSVAIGLGLIFALEFLALAQILPRWSGYLPYPRDLYLTPAHGGSFILWGAGVGFVLTSAYLILVRGSRLLVLLSPLALLLPILWLGGQETPTARVTPLPANLGGTESPFSIAWLCSDGTPVYHHPAERVKVLRTQWDDLLRFWLAEPGGYQQAGDLLTEVAYRCWEPELELRKWASMLGSSQAVDWNYYHAARDVQPRLGERVAPLVVRYPEKALHSNLSLSGRVMLNGQPLAGARVGGVASYSHCSPCTHSQWVSHNTVTLTDESGRFEIYGLWQGTYHLAVRLPESPGLRIRNVRTAARYDGVTPVDLGTFHLESQR